MDYTKVFLKGIRLQGRKVLENSNMIPYKPFMEFTIVYLTLGFSNSKMSFKLLKNS
jgi:hypothetical protein